MSRNPNVDEQGTNGLNVLANTFLLEPFYTPEYDYYNYRYRLMGGIIINSAVTIAFEKQFIKHLTAYYDNKR